MSNPKPLFIMGSKRSGSTFLVNALNLHPRVFVTHESDIVWILYQIYKDFPDRFQIYPFDEGPSMWATLNDCSEILNSAPSGTGDKNTIIQKFYGALTYINEHGRYRWKDSRLADVPQMRRVGKRENLAWIGDKKPVQYSDPEIQAFLNDVFPEARYIHLVRNPRFVVASMVESADIWVDRPWIPEYWKETPQKILENWTTHEEWVLQAKSRFPHKIRTIRLEDLAEDPVRIMSEIFNFLGLSLPAGTEEIYAEWAWKNPNRRHQSFELAISPRAYRIMQIYGYGD